MNKETFIKGVEKLVNPISVGTIHFIQYFNQFIPKSIQQKMVMSSGKKTPSMGFVIEPYSSFLCYEIKDLDLANSLLPDGFELVETKVFEEDKPRYMCIFGCTNAHTTGFIGSRVEFYIIAKNKKTNMTSWIIADYDTNTITYDPKDIFRDPNTKSCVITTDFSGRLFVDVTNHEDRSLIFDFDTSKGVHKKLSEDLWINGNLSIGYGKLKSINDPAMFSLTFNPQEFNTALDIDFNHFNLVKNNWFDGLFYDTPYQVICFPFAQHFLSDSPGFYSSINGKDELEKVYNNTDFDKISCYCVSNIQKMFLLNGIFLTISIIINIILVIILFI